MNNNIRKRTHLKSSQVAILQESFDNNPLPDSSVRSKLARELAVTERTIQIWFQNRRAKARKIEHGSKTNKPKWMESRHTTTPPRYQATFRTMMTPERFEELKQDQPIRRRPRSISKPEPKTSQLLMDITPNKNNPLFVNNTRAMSEGIYPTICPAYVQPQQVLYSSTPPVEEEVHYLTTSYQMVPLPVSVIRIGTWTRFAHITPNSQQKDWDLVCYCDPVSKEFVWRVQAEAHHFRIQIAFGDIQQIRLSQQIQVETGVLVGQLEIELNQLPSSVFSMWRFGQDNEWIRCGDFTEAKQASVDKVHVLQGNHESFKQSLLDLITLAPELAAKINVVPPAESNHNNLMLQAPFYYGQSPTNQSDIYQMMVLQQQPSSLLI